MCPSPPGAGDSSRADQGPPQGTQMVLPSSHTRLETPRGRASYFSTWSRISKSEQVTHTILGPQDQAMALRGVWAKSRKATGFVKYF